MVFSLPSLPSFQSVRSLLDTEPQVIYPSSAANTHTRPPASPSRAPTNAAGRVLPPVPDDWDRGRGKTRGRRQSVASGPGAGGIGSGGSAGASNSNSNGLGLNLTGNLGPGPTPGKLAPVQSRPAHRRSQSAVPVITVTPQPLSRLTEYSRNPLASTSATSLPTLAENEIDGPGVGGEGHTRTRRSSRASIYSQHSQYSQYSPYPQGQGVSLPSSPLRPAAVISQSVPLPLDLSVPPPPRARNQLLMRPPPTPRSWSSADVRLRISPPNSGRESPVPELDQNGRKNLTRHASYTQGHGKGKGSISQVSDVAVLATWSFPDTDPSSNKTHGRPVPDQGVSNLAERLKSLSTLQTDFASHPSPNHHPNTPNARRPSNASFGPHPHPHPHPHPSPGFGPTVLSSTPRNAGHPRIVHRSSHSSPNILNSARKGLRQPVPLGSGPSYLNRSNSNAHLGSSPGSLLSASDTTDTSSPTSSLHSLPGQPAPSQAGVGLGGWRLPWSRRNSMVTEFNAGSGLKSGHGQGDEDDMKERSFEDDDGELISCGSDRSDDEPEEYIDFGHF